MELVFVGPPAFLHALALLMPDSVREVRPVHEVERDDTAFVCPTDGHGVHLDPVYDSKAMFRGSQTNVVKTIEQMGLLDRQDRAHLPMGTALGVSVWGSAWLVASAGGYVGYRQKGHAANDAFFAAYVVARGLPGVKRLVCPPLCAKPGFLSYQASAAQIAIAYKHAQEQPETQGFTRPDSRGVPCYLAMFPPG